VVAWGGCHVPGLAVHDHLEVIRVLAPPLNRGTHGVGHPSGHGRRSQPMRDGARGEVTFLVYEDER
jgi:hypothetical protein